MSSYDYPPKQAPSFGASTKYVPMTVGPPTDDLPYTCQKCGERFGHGGKQMLLSIVDSMPFDENLSCCGAHVSGSASLDANGFIQIDEMEYV